MSSLRIKRRAKKSPPGLALDAPAPLNRSQQQMLCEFDEGFQAVALSEPRKTISEEPPKTQAQLLFQGQLNPKKTPKRIRLEQWIEIHVTEGRTVTTLYPSNGELIRKGQKMWPPPEYVYRRLSFRNGVPDEYAWSCTMTPEVRKYGGVALQRMTIDDWLEMIRLEAERGDGHVGSTIKPNLDRAPEYGECDCPSCTHNRKVAEEESMAKLLEPA